MSTPNARDLLSWLTGLTGTTRWFHGRAAAAGTVDECIEAIQAYVDIGVTHFILDSASPAEEIVEQYERAAKEIVPHFR